MADRAAGRANTAQTTFCIASMGKMFTAVAIAQLVERGALSFDDLAAAHLPGFPHPVTLHQLLTHTAGLGDVFARYRDSPPPADLAELVAQVRTEPLRFAPGSAFGYSNSGYVLLGAIVETVSGQPYAEYVREHIFGPAGMNSTAVAVYRPADVEGMAMGYEIGPDGSLRGNGDRAQVGNPSGGAYSTVGDLHAFAQALLTHRLLSADLTATLLAGKVESDRRGPGIDQYAYGFSDQTINGVRIVGHNGGTPGYEGELNAYPDLGYTVVLLSNQDGVLLPALRHTQETLTVS
jgi:CubicO group peptidase (beta-lactamase class C family)